MVCHTGSESHFYRHVIHGEAVREICTGEEVYTDAGEAEEWEAAASKEAGYGDPGEWPLLFDCNFVLKAFNLPSPWGDEPPLVWDIEHR